MDIVTENDIDDIRGALSLFASVIKSGEPWTTHCQDALERAGAALDRLPTRSAMKAEIGRVLAWEGPVMDAWDKARAELLDGNMGSLPRDILEGGLDAIHELPNILFGDDPPRREPPPHPPFPEPYKR